MGINFDKIPHEKIEAGIELFSHALGAYALQRLIERSPTLNPMSRWARTIAGGSVAGVIMHRGVKRATKMWNLGEKRAESIARREQRERDRLKRRVTLPEPDFDILGEKILKKGNKLGWQSEEFESYLEKKRERWGDRLFEKIIEQVEEMDPTAKAFFSTRLKV